MEKKVKVVRKIVEDMKGYRFGTAHGKCAECGAVGFHTKNIDHFGASPVYTFKCGCAWMKDRNNAHDCIYEDNCVGRLVVDVEAHAHIAACKRCQECGF